MSTTPDIITINFTNYDSSINELFSNEAVSSLLNRQKHIIIKPNLVNESPPPITTPAAICAAIVKWLKAHTSAAVTIAEGSGSISRETPDIFKIHGYTALSKKWDIPLVDLNYCETVHLKDPDCTFFPEFHLPRIIHENFLISVPVLKAHSLARITGTLKNMVGCAQPAHCQADGSWKKSVFHRDMDRAIFELNKYRTPDFTVLDATVGLPDHHLGGSPCSPPVNKIIGGTDPIAIDKLAAELLGRDWRMIPHISGKF